MRFHQSLFALSVASVLLCLPGTALAGPLGGARYDGRDATGKRAFVAVSKDGRRVQGFGFTTRPSCSDGKRHAVSFIRTKQKVAVLPGGSFNENIVVGGDRGSVTGQFDQSGNTVTGAYNLVVRARRYSCRTGDVTYTLHRDGTPGSPFRSAQLASGLYVGNGRGMTVRMRPLVPGGFIHSFVTRYRMRCRSGKTRSSADRIEGAVISKRSSFAVLFRARDRRVRHRFSIAGSFLYKGGYRVAGAIKARNVILRGGRVTDVCRATIPFTGLFRGGPLGEEGPHPTG